MLTALIGRYPFLKGMLDFAFPPICSGCGEFCEPLGEICKQCREKIEWFDQPICLNCGCFIPDSKSCPTCEKETFPLFALGNYRDPLKRIISRLKYHSVSNFLPILTSKVSLTFGGQLAKYSNPLLIPIPLHPSREYRRGYNQALLFANELSNEFGISTNIDILYRIQKKMLQSRLKEKDRSANIKGVFWASPFIAKGDNQKIMDIILVDDVATSGNTIFEAKRTLEEAGYRVVGAIAIAHGL